MLKQEARALLAELSGTCALTFVAVGTATAAITSHDTVDYISRVAAPGLTVMAMVYTLGTLSGAHINPAVTIAFALHRAFAWWRVPGYIMAQLIGATIAALLVHIIMGSIQGAPLPHGGLGQSLLLEIVLTVLLVTVIVGTATGSKIVGSNAGIAVGGTVALCGMLGATISGASMNPALSFGSLLVGGQLEVYWVYAVGAVVGTVIAVGFNYLTHGQRTPHELEAASGKRLRNDA